MSTVSRRWVFAASVLALAVGCNDGSDAQLACEDVEGDLVFCDDFSDGTAAGWTAEGGTWSVVDQRYHGNGPSVVDTSVCGVSLMTASLRGASEASDLAMHVELAGLERLDKVVVLRATDASNRIELNFRGEPLNDLVVQELVDCTHVFHVDEGELRVIQPEGEPLDVEVELRGDDLLVRVGGQTVLDRAIPFANADGRVGVAVIDRALTSFDSIWMRRL